MISIRGDKISLLNGCVLGSPHIGYSFVELGTDLVLDVDEFELMEQKIQKTREIKINPQIKQHIYILEMNKLIYGSYSCPK